MTAQHIINKTQQAISNPGTAVCMWPGYYVMVVGNGVEIEIDRINSSKWVYRSYDGDFYGETATLNEAIAQLHAI